MNKDIAKGLYKNDKFSLTNGDEVKTFIVISRNDEVDDAPEYSLKCIETGEIHSPVFWNWMNRDDLEIKE